MRIKPARKTVKSTKPRRRRQRRVAPQLIAVSHSTATEPGEKTFFVDFRFYAHVPIAARSLQEAFEKAKALTTADAYTASRKYRTEVAAVFSPTASLARLSAKDLGPPSELSVDLASNAVSASPISEASSLKDLVRRLSSSLQRDVDACMREEVDSATGRRRGRRS